MGSFGMKSQGLFNQRITEWSPLNGFSDALEEVRWQPSWQSFAEPGRMAPSALSQWSGKVFEEMTGQVGTTMESVVYCLAGGALGTGKMSDSRAL